MLAYELYLKNREGEDVGKNVVPVKKVFVNVSAVEGVNVKLDPKTLEHYGVSLDPKVLVSLFQEPLAMPSSNLSSVGLPNKGTGANSKKPYVEIYGIYDKRKLKLSIAGKSSEGQKETFDYEYNFVTGNETISTPSDLLFLRLDAECYFVDDKLLFDVYKDYGVIVSEGAVSSEVFTEVCKKFSSFWREKIDFENLKDFSRFTFRIMVLPFPLLTQGRVEYRSQDEEDSAGCSFEDCFGNLATGYPSKPTINAKFFSFDDEAFTINCKTGADFYKNLGIGNASFDKINLPSDRVIRISGLEWYFFELSDSLLTFETKNSGIYDQLLSNYNVLASRVGESVQGKSSLKIICAKRAQAKIEVLLDDNLTLDQMKVMFNRAQGGMSYHHNALESLIVETARDIIWADYIAAIRHFMNSTYFDRAVLVQRFTRILRFGNREKERDRIRNWAKSNDFKAVKEEATVFFSKSQFCLNLLTKNTLLTKNISGLIMDKNEEYAYKIGVIAGKYVKFKNDANESNNSTRDILTYSKYDRERLRFVFQRVGIGISLSKANIDNLAQAIKDNTPKEEIDDTHSHDDYSYFFYKGVFENLI